MALLLVFIVLLLLSGKIYYLGPAYPMLFAGGSVIVVDYIQNHSKKWLKIVLMMFIIYIGTVMLPIGLPVLSVRNMISYFEFGSKYMGTGEALRWEDGKRY